MFGQYQGYVYPQKQYELFDRELPYKSIKIPYHKQKTRVLKHVQQKHQLQQLRLQILDRCKFQELEYLEMLKKQREVMEEDIKRRKKQEEIQRMEEIIEQNRKISQRKDKKIKDSLDQFKRQEEIKKKKQKEERLYSAYSSSLESLNESYVKTVRPTSIKHDNLLEQFDDKKDFEQIKAKEVRKQDQIKKIKDELMNKYRFKAEPVKQPKPAVVPEEKTVVDWWVKKVRQFRAQEDVEQGRRPPPEPSSSEESSQQRSETSPPKKYKGKQKVKGRK